VLSAFFLVSILDISGHSLWSWAPVLVLSSRALLPAFARFDPAPGDDLNAIVI